MENNNNPDKINYERELCRANDIDLNEKCVGTGDRLKRAVNTIRDDRGY